MATLLNRFVNLQISFITWFIELSVVRCLKTKNKSIQSQTEETLKRFRCMNVRT